MQDYGYDQERAEVRRGVKWGLIALAAVLALVALIWGLNVATSGVRGQGDAIVQRNSAANWTREQANFEKLYEQVVATDKKITILYDRMEKNPDDKRAETDYYGTRSVCQSFIGDYNSKANSFAAENFRRAELPDRINELDPTTDCKEN